jgi:predicted NUDIX family NTP pyrophosphohydrolase
VRAPRRGTTASAGILAWRPGAGQPEFLLAHPGGPYWRGKEAAAWSIPKGLAEPGEDLLAAALREFEEELGLRAEGPFTALSPCRVGGGKTVHAWLLQTDLKLEGLRSNLVELEWPPRSGRTVQFPEVDRAEYAPADLALIRIHKGQRPILVEALARIAGQAAG